MEILIAAVGKLKPTDPLGQLITMYQQRMRWPLTIREVQAKTATTPDKEAEMLLEVIPPHTTIVLLDERGQTCTSQQLSQWFAEWQNHGIKRVAFVIGGDAGHGAAIRQKAERALAFGQATWPHMLVRVMLIEQIYRAQQILSGHPYHRG